jgi:hypothetical protein
MICKSFGKAPSSGLVGVGTLLATAETGTASKRQSDFGERTIGGTRFWILLTTKGTAQIIGAPWETVTRRLGIVRPKTHFPLLSKALARVLYSLN